MRLLNLFSKSAARKDVGSADSKQSQNIPNRKLAGVEFKTYDNEEKTTMEIACSKIHDVKRAHPVLIENFCYNSNVPMTNQVGQVSEDKYQHGIISKIISECETGRPASVIEGRRSLRRSLRLRCLLARFESHKHQAIYLDRLGAPNQRNDDVPGQELRCANRDDRDSELLQVSRVNDLLAKMEARKVSEKSILSRDSELTSATVCRHPSKQTSTPIIIPEKEKSRDDSFTECGEHIERITSSDPFADPLEVSTRSTDRTSSEYSGLPSRIVSRPDIKGERKNPFSTESQSSSPESSCLQTSSNESSSSARTDQQAAAIAFNELAGELHLPLLAPHPDDTSQAGHQVLPKDTVDRLQERRPLKRRSKVFSRIQTMRSTLHMRPQSGVPQEQSLRRMRTYASFPTRCCELNSLRGRTLDILARLGGHSFLTLPADFAPSALKLPSCFVAIVTYLRCFAPTVRNLFVDLGDLKMAEQIYTYFADQVLSAEKDQAIIEVTLRRDRMPISLVELLNRDTPDFSPLQVLSVARVFHALLEGLPGGILGSPRLYEILVSICDSPVSVSDAKRSSCLGGLSPETYIRSKAIGLAMVALLDTLQLDFACAVFGLCAILLHETERHLELAKQGFKGSLGLGRVSVEGGGFLSLGRLGHVFGPLLIDHDGDGSDSCSRSAGREMESQRVVRMMIENWRGISRQLRIWQSRGSGSNAQRGALPG